MSGSGGNRGVLDRARALRSEGHAFALALVTDTEGSTYRKPGALALVADDGERVGAISGGCLEPALDRLAKDALARGQVQVAMFDTRADDDLVFGSGSGCRGRMRVLAWPVEPGPHAFYDTLEAADRTALALELVVAVDEAHAGRGLAWTRLAGIEMDPPPGADALIHAGPGLHDLNQVRYARLQLPPAPALLLLGAGPEAPTLLRLARTLGWRARVADHREGLLAPARLADADGLVLARPAAALAATLRPWPAVLVMTHVAGTDLEALRTLATDPPAYVGLLGPPGRRDELLAQLTPAERESLQPRLHAPVGLPLGGEGPEAIALAIAADLQRHFHGTP